jgi:DNA processing protein
MSEDILYKIAITKVPKVGPITAKNLIGYCGSPTAVFKSSKKALMKIPGIGGTIADNILSGKGLELAEKECQYLEKNEVRALFYLDKDYPQRLKRYHDCPAVLYYKGNADLNTKRIIAIVGTRQPSTYGKIQCEALVKSLASFDALIVSGLAFGIDITAHKKSVEMGIPNIGVMGHGMSMIYPAEHQRIAARMITNGGLLTEFTHRTTPEREFFPMRNRIIAGLCDALIVVETAAKGGSMISASMAGEYEKKVFAIPGRIDDQMSVGCNQLIKDGKAKLLEGASDIADVLGWGMSSENGRQQSLFVALSEKEQFIVDALSDTRELSIDKLCKNTQIEPGEMASLLLDLEFRGLIKAKPGKRFILR